MLLHFPTNQVFPFPCLSIPLSKKKKKSGEFNFFVFFFLRSLKRLRRSFLSSISSPYPLIQFLSVQVHSKASIFLTKKLRVFYYFCPSIFQQIEEKGKDIIRVFVSYNFTNPRKILGGGFDLIDGFDCLVLLVLQVQPLHPGPGSGRRRRPLPRLRRRIRRRNPDPIPAPPVPRRNVHRQPAQSGAQRNPNPNP